ncbi:MAG: flippase-like domain-containing protein [Cytophagaceae bacterium]|nr:flippase-like domain-containing protein [Cytophagaceae bacterium]MDW8455827.1 lysylphosphatidylglycerol synthase transmembrane domain-containing protein [Cytophagaceae bacterium]
MIQKTKYRELLKWIFKISITFICIYWLSIKIDFVKVSQIIANSNWGYLFVAILLYIVSKVISAYRLMNILKSIKLILPSAYNMKLYWLGMYYNLFLPGSIGGDGYKVYVLKKDFPEQKVISIVRALLIDRVNGMLVLMLFTALFSFLVPFDIPYRFAITSAFILFLLLSIIISHYILMKSTVKIIPSTVLYSLGVQISQFAAAYLIILAIGIQEKRMEYLFAFMLSSFTSSLPVTVGGIGIREITLLYLTNVFQYSADHSVTVGLLFFCIIVLVSLAGIYYSYFPPKLIKKM